MQRVAAEMLVAISATAVMAALVLGTVTMQPLAPPGEWGQLGRRPCIEAPLSSLSESGLDGEARLCFDWYGLQPTLSVRRLQQGEVYAAWLAYFDQPSACFNTPCGFLDLRGDDPIGVLGRIDGAIAPATRELELRADLRDLTVSRGAQISLLILSQEAGNETDGRTRARQLLTPRMFDLGAPMAGALADRARGQLHAQAIFTIE